MNTDASPTSKGKDFNVADDSLTIRNSNIQELRKRVEELRNRELKDILARHESALRHLFYMNYMISKSDCTETYMTIVDDFSKVDQAELREFLQNHQLVQESMDNGKSAQPAVAKTAGQGVTTPTRLELSQNPQPIIPSQNQNDQTPQVRKQKRVSIPPMERMVTRAASGAITPKSVDDILKDAERHSAIGSSVTFTSPTTATNFKFPTKLTIPQKKQSPVRTSTVLPRNGEVRQLVAASMGRGMEYNQTRSFDRETLISNYHALPIYKLFQAPKKALLTDDWTVARKEVTIIRLLERVEELRNQGTWSFQQIEPFRDPPRTYTHWDYLLDEMVWMQKDFKKERKWKIAAAFNMVRWVQAWHLTNNKADLCVKRRIPGRNTPPHCVNAYENHKGLPSNDMIDGDIVTVKSEPDDSLNDLSLSQSKCSFGLDEVMIDVESLDDETLTRLEANQTNIHDSDSITMPPPIAPNVLSSLRQRVINLPPDAFICCLEGSDGQVYDVDSIFPDLPPYEPPQRPSDKDIYYDNIHYNRVIPISKRMFRRPKSTKRKPISDDYQRKRIKKESSDIETVDEPVNVSSETTLFLSQESERNSHIPVKAPRPDQDTPAIWYPEDDELLMSLTKQFQYNWDLVADAWNSIRGTITGYPRTAWACFQRWTQKDDTSRFIIQEHVGGTEDLNSASALDGGDDTSQSIVGQSTLTSRPKRDIPKKIILKPEIQKQRRNYSLLEAMKKSAKKRQDAVIKQSQTRKTNEQPVSLMHRVPTPIELSRLKSEQERQVQAALLEQRQVAALAYQAQAHARPMIMRPQPPAGMSFLAQGRPQLATANQLQALVMHQQRQVVAAQRIPTQHMTPSVMAQTQPFQLQQMYHIRAAQQAQQTQRAQVLLQNQQHQQLGQQPQQLIQQPQQLIQQPQQLIQQPQQPSQQSQGSQQTQQSTQLQ